MANQNPFKRLLILGALLAILTMLQPFTARIGASAQLPKKHLDASLVSSSSYTGYRIVTAGGTVYAHGADRFFGDTSSITLNKPIVGSASTSTGLGYWLVASDGGIFSFGNAAFFGSTGNIKLNKPIVGIAATPDGKGYWMVASDGGIFSFGDAKFFGSTGAIVLNKPVVGMQATPDGNGYWLVASDGGIFSFGDAKFFGSTGAIVLNKPVVGMQATMDGNGYWLVASDGGIFSFGDAIFFGSTGGLVLNKPVVGMQATPDTKGYWLVASDGGIFSFGDAIFFGSQASTQLSAPVTNIDSSPNLISALAGTTGFDVSNFQCGLTTAPTTGTFVMVEANGWPLSATNPCMAQEGTWAGGNYQLYTFMALPLNSTSTGYVWSSSVPTADYQNGPRTSGSLADQSYNFGYNAAQYALKQANTQGVSSQIWWIDIEGAGTFWSSSPTYNTAAIQGAADYFSQAGIIAGLYSGHATMYAEITTGTTSGPGATILGPGGGPIPIWFYSSSGVSACTSLTDPTGALNPFAGGIPWYIQTGFGSNYDSDVAC